ncbi:MAG: glycosyltransferase family 2 protein [Eubacterium sp.]|nr:glycosyltransferase family 2 protein [Eubacterium sp.]
MGSKHDETGLKHGNGSRHSAEDPLVSIIIRTCGRPHILKHALESIRRQTYRNLEVIIVEDGKQTAQKMLQNDFADFSFPYLYEATGKHVGRSRAGNQAMQLSSGKYLNFLDDDDGLLPEHVECLVRALCGRKEKAAYSVAQERQIVTRDIRAKRNFIRYRQPFHRLLLCTCNYIPIQSMLFERSLFETYGGFDEKIERMEDWDLWVRYSMATDFVFVNQVTSYYHVPYGAKGKKKRGTELKRDADRLHEKFRLYHTTMSAEQLRQEMEYVIREYKNKGLVRYIRMFFRMFVLGEL